jgi:hypothetical protein
LVVTALGALLSFSVAVGYSLLARPQHVVSDESEPTPVVAVRQPSKDLGIRTRRDLLPGAQPLPAAVALSDELDSLHEARQLARSATSGKKPGGKAPTTRTVVKKPVDAATTSPAVGGD